MIGIFEKVHKKPVFSRKLDGYPRGLIKKILGVGKFFYGSNTNGFLLLINSNGK